MIFPALESATETKLTTATETGTRRTSGKLSSISRETVSWAKLQTKNRPPVLNRECSITEDRVFDPEGGGEQIPRQAGKIGGITATTTSVSPSLWRNCPIQTSNIWPTTAATSSQCQEIGSHSPGWPSHLQSCQQCQNCQQRKLSIYIQASILDQDHDQISTLKYINWGGN